MKKCSKCKDLKDFDSFYKSKVNKDGYRNSCILCIKEYGQKNKETKKEYLKNYKNINKEKLKIKNKKYREENQYKIKKWKEENKDYFIQYRQDNKLNMRNYIKNRLDNDHIFRFKYNMRRLVLHSFRRGKKNFKKADRTEAILGCKIEEFINHISKKFTEGMSIENHGKWHIDHIIPLATAKTEQDVIRLTHYTNLQPLWAKDNLSKGSKIIINY